MEQTRIPVDVISLCSADGEIRPLRIRVADDSQERFRGNVREILQVKETRYVGAESRTFLCRVQMGERSVLMELRYFLRSHSWQLTRQLY